MAAYATPADLLSYRDLRTLGDLVTDYGARVNATDLLTNDNLQAALDAAAGEINSSALIGLRYSVVDLQALTGVDLAFLVNLNCELAFYKLLLRRGIPLSKYPEMVECKEMLDRLKRGDSIFNVPTNVGMGQVTAAFPSTATLASVNLMTEYANRFFPTPRKQVVP